MQATDFNNSEVNQFQVFSQLEGAENIINRNIALSMEQILYTMDR